MSTEKTLWQRCEALGPIENDWCKIHAPSKKHYLETTGVPVPDFYRITVKGAPFVWSITPESTLDWSFPILDLIISHFEQVKRSSRDETGGRHKDPDFKGAQCPVAEIPNVPPTHHQILGLIDHLNSPIQKPLKNIKWIDQSQITGDRGHKVFFDTGFREFSATITHDESGLSYYSATPFAKFCEACGYNPNPLPIPETLSDKVSYIAGSPQEFVSIPVAEWRLLKAAFTTMGTIFNSPIQPVEFES